MSNNDTYKLEVDLEYCAGFSFDEYQRLAMRTANPKLNKEQRLVNAALGLGEVGEVQNLIKKHLSQGHPLNAMEVLKEAGDALWYIAELAEILGFDLSVVALENIQKLKDRYPEGFSTERSINRED